MAWRGVGLQAEGAGLRGVSGSGSAEQVASQRTAATASP